MNLNAVLELKDTDDNSDAAVVTKALKDFQIGVDDRLKAIETKANDNALKDRLDKIEAKINRPGHESKGGNADAAIETKAFAAYLRDGKTADPLELKALNEATDTQGGFLAPTEMSEEFIRDLVEYSPIRSLASVRQTSAPSVTYPKRIGRTNAKWKGEMAAQETGEPTFDQLEVPVLELTTYVDISNRLLADAPQAMVEVRVALSEDFGLKEGLAFAKGAGDAVTPEGIMTNADVAVTKTGNAATLGANPSDLLIAHMYSLPAGYRSRGTWLMNGTTLAALRKLKDGQGNYLWQPSYQSGQPEMILGRPVIEVPDMDDVGAAKSPILFGDIARAYRVIDRLDLSVLVNPYLLATNGTTRIHATRRVGAGVIQPAAIRKITCAVDA